MRMTKFSEMNFSAPDKKLREAFSQGVASSESLNKDERDGLPMYKNYMELMTAKQSDPLIEKSSPDDDADSEEDEVIIPKSEFVAIGKAIQPQSLAREITSASLPQKKKLKNKTVTFSPVAMVTPLPSGSEESVPEDAVVADPKINYLEMYSKTMPTRSPDKVKKVVLNPGSQDDMCLPAYCNTSCENVTEEDLWKAFNITLSDNGPSKPMIKEPKQPPPVSKKPTKVIIEDPDYDENPYDNLPYINIGSLRRHNTPETNSNDLYKEIMKRHQGREPAMESIPETC